MKKNLLFSIILGIFCSIPSFSSAMNEGKDEFEQAKQELFQLLGLMKSTSLSTKRQRDTESNVAEKKRKIEEFKRWEVRPVEKRNRMNTLLDIAAYSIVANILDGTMTYKHVFGENLTTETKELLANLKLTNDETLLYRVSTPEDLDLLISNGARLFHQSQALIKNKDGIFAQQTKWGAKKNAQEENLLCSLIIQGKEDVALRLLEYIKNMQEQLKISYSDEGSYFSIKDFHKHMVSKKLDLLRQKFFALYPEKIVKKDSYDIDENKSIWDRSSDNYIEGVHGSNFNYMIVRGELRPAEDLFNKYGTTFDFSRCDQMTGRTPLMNALLQGYFQLAAEIIGVIKRSNKSPKEKLKIFLVRDTDGFDATLYAIENAPELIKLILENPQLQNIVVLVWAITCYANTHYEHLIDYILDNHKFGGDINRSAQKFSRNSLVSAVKSDNERLIIKLVKDKGAAINSETVSNKTPLWYAIKKGSLKLLELLVKLGADVNFRTSTGDTPLRNAMNFYLKKVEKESTHSNLLDQNLIPIDNWFEIIKSLVTKGAIVHKTDIEYFDQCCMGLEIAHEKVAQIREYLTTHQINKK